jgi:hypothetical protein
VPPIASPFQDHRPERDRFNKQAVPSSKTAMLDGSGTIVEWINEASMIGVILIGSNVLVYATPTAR